MSERANGTFDVKIAQLQAYNADPAASLARMSIDKQFHGDLEATSKGEMLSAGRYDTGSAGYVAVERVTGTLKGRSGSFSLQHSATMNRGAADLSVRVVPDSGSEALTGLSGRMNIIIAKGQHSYEFDYDLGDA